MSLAGPYVLSSSALQEMLRDSENWKRWYNEKNTTEEGVPHSLFISAFTFGIARLEVASFMLAYDEDEEVVDVSGFERPRETDNALKHLSQAEAWKRRILPVNAEVMNICADAFRTIDEFLRNKDDDEDDPYEWSLPTEALIEFSTASYWDATLVFASDWYETETVFHDLAARFPDFRLEDISPPKE